MASTLPHTQTCCFTVEKENILTFPCNLFSLRLRLRSSVYFSEDEPCTPVISEKAEPAFNLLSAELFHGLDRAASLSCHCCSQKILFNKTPEENGDARATPLEGKGKKGDINYCSRTKNNSISLMHLTKIKDTFQFKSIAKCLKRPPNVIRNTIKAAKKQKNNGKNGLF